MQKQKGSPSVSPGRLPPGDEVTGTRAHVSYHSKTTFFFLRPTEVQSRTKFLNPVICGLSDRWGSEDAERRHRSEETKLSRARMPEQRRAGQLVDDKVGEKGLV